MAEYSGSIVTWDDVSTYILDDQVGWNGQLWTATGNVAADSEPTTDNTDWDLDTPVDFKEITLVETHERGDTSLSKVDFEGVTIVEEHVDKIDVIKFSSLTLKEYVEQPVYPSLEYPDKVTNIRSYKLDLTGRQLETEKRLTNND